MQRLPFVDWARGFAVVAMVLWHTGDAWLLPGLKDGQGFFALRFVGGLAAPSFLFLAGVGAALAVREGTDRRAALTRGLGRGLEIVVIGYALRLQSWLIDAQALLSLRCARATVPLVTGYTLAWLCARSMARGERVLRWRAWLAVGAITLGLAQVPTLAPTRFTRLLQVDVLQCIGGALCVLALLEHTLAVLRRPARAIPLAALVALGAEPLATLLPGALPTALAAFFARLPLKDGVLPALFPLFPWLAYALLGAALGHALRGPRPERAVLWAALVGAVCGLCTSEAQPFVARAIHDHPWAVAPIRTSFRAAIVCTLLMLSVGWLNFSRGTWLTRLGQHSLRVYWAHMLFAYGLLGRPVQRELGYAGWLGLALALLVVMWLVSGVERVFPRRAERPKIRLEPGNA